MSWLSDLADKAENLLNKIDQNAAAVLQEKDNKGHLNHSHDLNASLQHVSQPQQLASVSKRDLNFDQKKTSFKAKSIKGNNKKVTESNSNARLSPRKNNSEMSQALKQSSSFGHFTAITESKPEPSGSASDSTSVKDETIVTFNIGNEDLPTEVSTHINEGENLSVISNNSDHFINMENELLRNEISVVNNEVSLLIAKAKNAEKVADESQMRLRQLENTYTQLLKDKESLEEKLYELEQQKNSTPVEIFSDTSELEENIRSLEEEKQHLQEKLKQLELSKVSNASLKLELESDLKESQKKCSELEDKLEKAKTETNQVLQEWKNYKIRANNTLNMKEKIIEELGGSAGDNAGDLVTTLNTQISQLKMERDELLEESSMYQAECEEKAKDIEQLEHRTTATERQLSILREAFRQEKAAREVAEHTVSGMTKELKSVQHETTKQISVLRGKLRESQPRENERLVSSSNVTTTMNISETGEERVRLLTQALVGKQAALESVTADRNGLRLQLEKTENKYRSDLISMRNNQPRIVHVNDTDDVKAKFPSLMQENPWDSNFSRGAKKVYSTLDSFSVRVGLFLRRNPVARIFIISYMIILHLWVFIVLFTYTP